MKVLFAITEADPFIKTGGLGEVGGSLPLALQEQGIEIRVILPKYSGIPNKYRQAMEPIDKFEISLAWRKSYCGLEKLEYEGIHYYFIDNEFYFKRTRCYGDGDEAEQYAFFCRAVLESIRYFPEFKPDIIHCHDWHTALIPLFLRAFYGQDTLYYNIRTLFTIHNLKYQGVFSKEVLTDVLGLNWEYFAPEKLEFHGGINFMKAGITYSNQVTTVSPTYAQEIQNSYYGEGLHGVISRRQDSLLGIINGIPRMVYAKDLIAKAEEKKKLQARLELEIREDVPILTMVSRLVDQKGLDLLLHVLDEILTLDIQMVIHGTGDSKYEEMLRGFGDRYHNLRPLLYYDEELAHSIYAGGDIFLMPSRFEPCGIAQMIAMAYGNIPIVRETGGLKDTVKPYSLTAEEGNGFTFSHYNAHDFLYTVQRAVHLFKEDKKAWLMIQKNAIDSDFSWSQSAAKYQKIYESLYYQQPLSPNY